MGKLIQFQHSREQSLPRGGALWLFGVFCRVAVYRKFAVYALDFAAL